MFHTTKTTICKYGWKKKHDDEVKKGKSCWDFVVVVRNPLEEYDGDKSIKKAT